MHTPSLRGTMPQVAIALNRIFGKLKRPVGFAVVICDNAGKSINVLTNAATDEVLAELLRAVTKGEVASRIVVDSSTGEEKDSSLTPGHA